MSRKNSPEAKAARRAAKASRESERGAIDLVKWIKMRRRVSSGMARKIILSGAIQLDGEPVGFVTDVVGVKRLAPFIPAEHAADLQVVVPKDLA